ncbi:hypothetical protein BH23PLA1_BH23PLA1_07060 [soil metagenome]
MGGLEMDRAGTAIGAGAGAGAGWKFGIGLAMAVLVPVLVLDAMADPERSELGLTAAPFARQRLLIAHVLTAAPLALVVAARWADRLGPVQGRASAMAWAVLGTALALAVGSLTPSIGLALDSLNAGLLIRTSLRTLLVFGLELPWMLLVVRWTGGTWTASEPEPGVPVSGWAPLVVALALAMLPPAAYADRLAESRASDLQSHLETGRIARARVALRSLLDLGTSRPVGDLPPALAYRSMLRELDRLDRASGRSFVSSDPEARLQRAFTLIQLDRLEEATRLLGPLAETDTTAALMLAAIWRDVERWSDSERIYRQVLEEFLPRADHDPDALAACLTAFDGLALAGRSSGRPEVAEAAFLQARAGLPDHAAYFAGQLGRHYLDGGRPANALEQFQEAIRLDPDSEASLAPLIRSLRVQTPLCVPRR